MLLEYPLHVLKPLPEICPHNNNHLISLQPPVVHPQGIQPVPSMQAPSGPVVPTPEQLGKIRSELDIVHGNITVMSEMLTEMTPGQEEAGDLQLLQVKLQCPFCPCTDFPLLEYRDLKTVAAVPLNKHLAPMSRLSMEIPMGQRVAEVRIL